MERPNSPIIKVSELYQTCIVVRDLEKSMEHYRNVLGIGAWEIIHCDPSVISDMMYRGRPVTRPFQYRAALTMVGPMQLELIQPIEGDLLYSDFLNEHGEGLHHLGHLRVQNLDEGVQAFEKAGFSCLQRGRFMHVGFAYMDTTKALGFILELLDLPEGVPVLGVSGKIANIGSADGGGCTTV